MDKTLQLLESCGPFGYLLFGALLVALWIFLERFFCYHRCQINVEDFLHGLFNVVRNHNLVEAVAICDSKPTPVSKVVRAVITNHSRGDWAQKQATDEVAMSVIPGLERGVKLLAGIGNIAPILGLLGTLLSLMNVFAQVKETGNFTPMAELIGPVMNALFTTALGLIVALAVHCFYFILTECLNSIIGDMEKAAAEMTYFMVTKDWHRRVAAGSAGVSEEHQGGEQPHEEERHDAVEN